MSAALDIDDLYKSYGGTPAVKGISLSIEPGEIFGLLGPNGAGKSTTINMVSGVTRIDRGQIRVFGHDNRREYRTTRCLVGVMHQEIVIDHFFTIDRALRIHPGYYGVGRDPDWLGRLVEALGLGPHLHKPMNQLSGGLKRRFMVAKALCHKPRLLILDEPTAGVDVELRRTLWQFVREINAAGTTVLLTTHYLEEAEQMCGRIAIMNDGELVALQSKEELLAQAGSRSLFVRLSEPLGHLPEQLAPFTPRHGSDPRTLVLSLPPSGGAGVVLKRLTELGLEVVDLDVRQSRLEEVFLRLTGRTEEQP